MNKQILGAIIVVAVVLVGLGAWLANQPQTAENDGANSAQSETRQSGNQQSDPGNSTATETTVIFTDNGFDKSSYTVRANQPVTVLNNASFSIEFSSDDHPTHRENPELNLAPLSPGQKTIFTPTRTGSWHVHDHEHPEFTTELVVRP